MGARSYVWLWKKRRANEHCGDVEMRRGSAVRIKTKTKQKKIKNTTGWNLWKIGEPLIIHSTK